MVSEETSACPNCGATLTAQGDAEGVGFEYKSDATLLGWPLLHISFKYRPNRRPVPAGGIIAIGQFAYGVVTISQVGLGIFSVGQCAAAGFALAQFAVAYSLIAQFGIFIHEGRGLFVKSVADIIRLLF